MTQVTEQNFRPVRVVYQIPGTVQTTKIVRTPAALTFQRQFCERHLIEIHETPLAAAELAAEGRTKRLVGIVLGSVAVVTLVVSVAGAIRSGSTSACSPVAAGAEVPATEAVKYGGTDLWAMASPSGGLWLTTSDPALSSGGLVLPLNGQARSESDMGAAVPPSAPAYRGKSSSDAAARKALACA